ncbi:SDR family oxidoreductase [uncultured Alsobacter sp.]|uniref:SDR family NAD(P)-dependent oxidoreductase n=1 Tax=uncultured Alsobacter sp. TaxID=1748258 RepID=UPI0025F200E9|nr:SDR family oxidoreductase [uncultured Alsobacter sp.]
MRLTFDRRVALVTGAGQPIGNAIACALVQSGATVHVADTPESGLADRAHQIGAKPHLYDIRNRHAAHEVVRGVLESEGRLDIVVNAGHAAAPETETALEDIDEEAMVGHMVRGTDTTFWLAQACAPTMKRAGYGRIVTVAAPARDAKAGDVTAVQQAVAGLTRQLSGELAPHGITVNTVLSGVISTDPEQANGNDHVNGFATLHTRRHGRAEDVAHAALFFVSDEAGWISGQVLPVDGGRF